MARRELLNDDETRLLKIAARMPLASVANLAPVLGLDEERVRRMLGALRRGGWVTSVVRGMTERRQHRWFLTRRAVDLPYVTDHQHPAPREEARAAGLASFHPEGELPQDYRERFALDHDHPVHLEGQGNSPFASGDASERRPRPRAPALDRHVAGSGDVPAQAGHGGAGLPPGPRPAPQRARQPARRRHGSVKGCQDDRLPTAAPRRLLPRRGKVRTGPLDPLHLRRTPRHRADAAEQGAAPLLGG